MARRVQPSVPAGEPSVPSADVDSLEGWLRYLGELGYEEVYLPRTEAARGVAASAPGVTVAAADTRVDRAAALESLREQSQGCTRCVLSEKRLNVVFGSGDPDAALMFVGEAPGAQEDRQGLPFVGAAGELLTRIIEAIGMQREDVYIANIVKCRPPRNRDPAPEEAAACREYLDGQIDLVRPRAIVALGRVAAQSLLGNNMPVGKLRGGWHRVRGVPLRVTYHPAALLRNDRLKRPTWEDMKAVREYLADSSA